MSQQEDSRIQDGRIQNGYHEWTESVEIKFEFMWVVSVILLEALCQSQTCILTEFNMIESKMVKFKVIAISELRLSFESVWVA